MRGILMAAALASLTGLAAGQVVYSDNTGNHLDGGDLHDFFASQSFNHLDIVSVTVSNDANFVYFDIQLNADIDATNWGKYIVGIDTGANAGDNSTDPGSWNRNVDWGRGITHFMGTWADDGGSGAGAELRSFDGTNWGLMDATYIGGGLVTADDSDHASGVQRVAFNFAALGLSIGQSFEFDVFSSGGGSDPGVDHLSRADFATDQWGTTSVAGSFLSYTLVPAPGAMALLGMGGLLAARRRR